MVRVESANLHSSKGCASPKNTVEMMNIQGFIRVGGVEIKNVRARIVHPQGIIWQRGWSREAMVMTENRGLRTLMGDWDVRAARGRIEMAHLRDLLNRERRGNRHVRRTRSLTISDCSDDA